MSYAELPQLAPTPLQTIADQNRQITRLKDALAEALADADMWHDVAHRMHHHVDEALYYLGARDQRWVVDARGELTMANKVWEKVT